MKGYQRAIHRFVFKEHGRFAADLEAPLVAIREQRTPFISFMPRAFSSGSRPLHEAIGSRYPLATVPPCGRPASLQWPSATPPSFSSPAFRYHTVNHRYTISSSIRRCFHGSLVELGELEGCWLA